VNAPPPDKDPDELRSLRGIAQACRLPLYLYIPAAVTMGPVEQLVRDAFDLPDDEVPTAIYARARELDRELAREAETKPDLHTVPDGAPKPRGAK
jgi:hypothetical protein